ncbi:MAG: dihydropteroate synthase [Actinomycetes bacterium]
MAVLNVTPDSFSDGGRFLDSDAAVGRALQQVQLGADLIDVGGESTRPGAERIPVTEELDRVLPVIYSLVAADVYVSIDTMRAEVAREAVTAGAVVVNDVSGGLADIAMLPLIAELAVPAVLMHWRGHSRDMQSRASYPTGVVHEVAGELKARLAAAVDAGVAADRVVLDPGLGFAKDSDHNWGLLKSLDVLSDLGQPVLVGASRKRFLGELLATGGEMRALDLRDDATVAITALAAASGAWCVRVHDARGNVDAVRVAEAWKAGRA